MANGQRTVKRILMTGVALAALAACEDFDPDFRDVGNGFDTSSSVANLPNRPRPDDRGVISYPTYQVVVARKDDTIRGIAIRLGIDANELAEYNGVEPDVILRRDEIIALPGRVAEPSAATGATQPFDVTAVATTALDRAEANGGTVTATPLAPVPAAAATPIATPSTAPTTQAEPVRHQVARGETVYSISRLYNVPVTAIAEWNGLDSAFTIRQGQFLLIPQGGSRPAPATTTTTAPVTAPGQGTTTPVPPSASTPLPATTPSAPVAAPAAPDIGATAAPAESNSARMVQPVQGSIIREYAAGRNEGIDIGAPSGTAVKAADAGSVAAVTADTSGGSVVVIKHSDGLLTLYTHLDSLTIEKGDTVSRGETIGKVRAGEPSMLHFEVRRGLQSVDPAGYLP
ncbi:peptidoglycan DD-metalloendopeptidase family protein [Yoonia maritima]|uniref:peptidoglycan DD-metalloendopeptidase family protein n=1 Tax=Yoonia maritima TaxID=1435347 RepID=UPI000D111BED|nr:peptidoglycan DD-metalloendopeptidase family protein [Yoonia maritima]